MSKEGKHHYIPVFYLKQWTGRDGRLCEFSRPHTTVKPRRVHPDGTGYMHGLNTIPGLPADEAQYIERDYLKKLDDKAAIALQTLLKGQPLNKALTVAWASFLYSLTLRPPESLKKLAEQYEKTKAEIAAKKGLPVPQGSVSPPEFLPTFLASRIVIPGLAFMRWSVKSTRGARNSLLTSDRPIIMTNGLAKPTDHLAIPISPTTLFFAANNDETFNRIRSMPADHVVEIANARVCEQAIKFIYGTDDRQLRFAANRLGKRVPSSPLS
jgi:hypothetical protein